MLFLVLFHLHPFYLKKQQQQKTAGNEQSWAEHVRCCVACSSREQTAMWMYGFRSVEPQQHFIYLLFSRHKLNRKGFSVLLKCFFCGENVISRSLKPMPANWKREKAGHHQLCQHKCNRLRMCMLLGGALAPWSALEKELWANWGSRTWQLTPPSLRSCCCLSCWHFLSALSVLWLPTPTPHTRSHMC